MNNRTTIYCTLLAVTQVGAAPLRAQSVPGTNLTATVRVRAVTMSHDSATVSYSLLMSRGSSERLEFFAVGSSAPSRTVTKPSPSSRWMVAELFAGRSVAMWLPLQGIAPGDSTPTLTFTATGLPGIATAWYHGDSLPTLGVDSTDGDLFHDFSKTVVTVGVDVAPRSLSELISRLKVLTGSSCSLRWITDSNLCNALGSTLAASPASVLSYAARLDAARTAGSAVTDAAYFMFTANVEYIKAVEMKVLMPSGGMF